MTSRTPENIERTCEALVRSARKLAKTTLHGISNQTVNFHFIWGLPQVQSVQGITKGEFKKQI